jgi:hypothetical protein
MSVVSYCKTTEWLEARGLPNPRRSFYGGQVSKVPMNAGAEVDPIQAIRKFRSRGPVDYAGSTASTRSA